MKNRIENLVKIIEEFPDRKHPKRIYILKCGFCGKEFERLRTPINVTRKTIDGKYCSKKCSYSDRINKFSLEKHNNWKGGKHLSNGYIKVLTRGRNKSGYTYEHILIMERQIGRRIEKGEVVHHINGNKLDNRIENLELKTISQHMRDHGFYNKTKTGSYIHCENCGKEKYVIPSRLKKRKHLFCSPECSQKWESNNYTGIQRKFFI